MDEIRHSIQMAFICTSVTWLPSYRRAVLLQDTHRVGEGGRMGMAMSALL